TPPMLLLTTPPLSPPSRAATPRSPHRGRQVRSLRSDEKCETRVMLDQLINKHPPTLGALSGRREAPRAARQSRLAPVSSRPPINRTLGFPQSGCKRAPISGSVPLQHSQDGLTDQPECHGCARG